MIILMFLLCGMVFGQEYHQKHILFCLRSHMKPLHIEWQNHRPVSDHPQINRLLEKYGVVDLRQWLPHATDRDVVDDIRLSHIYQATFASEKSMNELTAILQEFRRISDVHSAELESINRIAASQSAYVPSDPYFDRQWYVKKIMADEAWGLWRDDIPGDSTIIIGIVDTGIDYLHPDLAGAMFINPGEDIDGDGKITEADKNGIDDDGNRYIDDFMGWDFADQNNDVRPPEAGPTYDLSHGSHVAGIAAATADNGIGIAGISFRARILGTKHAKDTDLSDPGLIYAYSGILYCAQMGAKIINCSWGGGPDFYGKTVLNDVTQNYGAIVVCAAGNSGTDNDSNPHYPSDYDNTLAVASTNSADKKAYYSNYGSIIDISAPGGEGSGYSTAIYSTIHDNAGSYIAFQGTSMASPVVAGSLALLKAWFPDSSRDWLINTLLNSADPIDDLNPSYQGKLGSGRVNIYNAIARSVLPSLSVLEFYYEIINDSERSELQPGDSARLFFLIENEEGWQKADQTILSVRTPSPDITFSDSVAYLGSIAAGDAGFNNEDEIVLHVSADAKYEPFELIVTLQANTASTYTYEESLVLSLQVSLNQSGFPQTAAAVSVPVTVGNLSGDLRPEIVVAGEDNRCYAYQQDGSLLDGFPVDLGAYISSAPAMADMDADGYNEIVITTRTGVVQVIRSDGSIILGKAIGEQVFGNIALANMDDDAQLEMVFGTMSRKLHVLKPDGNWLDGFPKDFGSAIEKGLALADLTGDSIPEIIFGLLNKDLHVITIKGDSLASFPITLPARVSATPLVIQNDTDFHIVVSCTDNQLRIIDATGTVTASYPAGAAITAPAGLSDWDGDGRADIFFGSDNGLIHGITLSGDTLNHFPMQLDGAIKTSPLFADFNNDGRPEIVVTTATGFLYIIDQDGNLLNGFPARLEGALNGSSAIADVDGDGDWEIITGGTIGLHVFDVPGQKGEHNIWQTYLGNNRRTGNYADALTHLASRPLSRPPVEFRLLSNYPNPFNQSTMITYQLPRAGKVQVTIFNRLGQKVATLFSGNQSAGIQRILWQAPTLASGLYICQVRFEQQIRQGKLLLIK